MDIYRVHGVSNFVLCDAHFLPFKADSFAKIFLLETLDAVYSPARVLGELHRVLKVNGRLILSLPNIYYFKRLIRWILNETPISQHKGHIQAWSMAEIKRLLQVCGFQVADYSFIDYKQHHHGGSLLAKVLPRITKHSFRLECLAREKEHLSSGIKFIVPLPEVEITHTGSS
jgi:ubiquinone/menaquinone biosynthesis C-methylase UbiE